MLYEPVGYIVEYEVSAIIFLVVIMLRYFGARRFPNQKNRLFSLILWVILADMSLDVVSSLIIDNLFAVPLPITYVVNGLFYSLQILLPLLMTAYTVAMAEHLCLKTLKKFIPLMIPGAVTLFLMFLNPLTHWLFYIDPERGYVHGALFIFTYAVCFLYIGVTFWLTLKNRALLRREEFLTICRFLVIVLVSIIIQYIYPELLISGVAMALAVILMYFTIQNPDMMIDTTTGAFTSKAMFTFLTDRVQEKEKIQLVALHVQNMHRINDLLGVENGNGILREVSRYMRECTVDSWVFRMRGSCFVAVTRNYELYKELSEKIERRIGEPWEIGGSEILVHAAVCRISAEELSADTISPDEAVSYIESAFLQSQKDGGRIKSYTVGKEFLERFERKRAVEIALREALKDGSGFELYFQPLWAVKQKRFVSAEVLLRFKNEELGYISPEEFVPIAESNGLVTAMDEMVLRKACEFIRDNDPREKLGLEAIEINLSALEFMHSRFPEHVDEIMSEYKVDPGFVYFEITETAASESFELLEECMSKLRDKGCRFALDDFGTGYANISQVIQLPFSMVKLDKSLLFGSEIVLGDLARMFARMHLSTVVEGVELPYQAELMESLQIDYIQGFYFAKPMNQNDFIKLLEDNSKTSYEI